MLFAVEICVIQDRSNEHQVRRRGRRAPFRAQEMEARLPQQATIARRCRSVDLVDKHHGVCDPYLVDGSCGRRRNRVTPALRAAAEHVVARTCAVITVHANAEQVGEKSTHQPRLADACRARQQNRSQNRTGSPSRKLRSTRSIAAMACGVFGCQFCAHCADICGKPQRHLASTESLNSSRSRSVLLLCPSA